MSNHLRTLIYCTDDDPVVRNVVKSTFEPNGFEVSCFDSAYECVQQFMASHCDLIITEVKMPRLNGILLLKEIRTLAPWLPVLIASADLDKSTVIKAFRAGATDVIEKPLAADVLLASVESALMGVVPGDDMRGVDLSGTEMRVLRFILQGKCNTEIAYMLNRSLRTVEGHRNHIMRKLDAHNPIELIKRAVQLGLIGIETLTEDKTPQYRPAGYSQTSGQLSG